MNGELASTTRGSPDRSVPESGQAQLIEVEQVSRYLWAAQAARARLVLDAGCGTGYGSRLLAESGAREVIGVDLARTTLEMARPGMPESVRLVLGDLRELEFEDDRFELVVCFEVIEYVENPLVVLNELIRVLAPGGLLLVSSPNRDAYQPGNPHRLHEFAPAELERALAAKLSHVQLLRQHHYVVSALTAPQADNREGDGGNLVLNQLAGDPLGDEIYAIAMASDAELPAIRDLAAVAGSARIGQWLSLLEMQAAESDEKDNQIDELHARVSDRDRLVELLGEAEHRAAELPVLKLRIADLERELDHTRLAALAARREADQLDRMLMYGRRMLRYVRPFVQPMRRLRRKLRR